MAELTDQQKRAAELLVLGNKRNLVALELQIDRRTLYTWEQIPAFIAEKTSLQTLARREAIDRLRELSGKAVSKLEELLNDPETPAAVAANICFRLLALNFAEGAISTLPVTSTDAKADLTPEKIAFVRESVYGIFDSDDEEND